MLRKGSRRRWARWLRHRSRTAWPDALLTASTVSEIMGAAGMVVKDSRVEMFDSSDQFDDAACLPVAWGTAYRMLTTRAGLRAGDTVLVQGASGGVSSAAIWIARALGARVYATARTPEKRAYAVALGAQEAFESGGRLPERVDVVVDTVGEATWKHSLRSLKPGGCVVTCGATSGASPDAELNRIFYLQLRIIGSTMCTLGELHGLLDLIGRHPLPDRMIDRVLPLERVHEGVAALASGQHVGKIVVRP